MTLTVTRRKSPLDTHPSGRRRCKPMNSSVDRRMAVECSPGRAAALLATAAASLTLTLPAGKPAAAPASAARAQKPPLAGLISMGDIRFHRHDDVAPDNSLSAISASGAAFGGLVMNITWRQIEPVPGVFDTSAIDQSLAEVRAYNRRRPNMPLGVDLRIWTGRNAPMWAKRLAGGPIPIRRVIPGQPEEDLQIGPFWSSAYRNAYRRMQQFLAGRYDREPLIREVSDTACASLSDEPFNLPRDPISLAALRRAGLTDGAYQSCLSGSIADFSGWRATNVQFTFNPYRSLSGVSAPDLAATVAIMGQFRRALGLRGVLSNHSLMPAGQRPWLEPLYAAMLSLGRPIEFQTEAPKHEGFSWSATFSDACAWGGGAVEIWQGDQVRGFDTLVPGELTRAIRLLKGGRC